MKLRRRGSLKVSVTIGRHECCVVRVAVSSVVVCRYLKASGNMHSVGCNQYLLPAY